MASIGRSNLFLARFRRRDLRQGGAIHDPFRSHAAIGCTVGEVLRLLLASTPAGSLALLRGGPG